MGKYLIISICCFCGITLRGQCDSLSLEIEKRSAIFHTMKKYSDMIDYLDKSASFFMNCDYYEEGLSWLMSKVYCAKEYNKPRDTYRFLTELDKRFIEHKGQLNYEDRITYEIDLLEIWSEFSSASGNRTKQISYLTPISEMVIDSSLLTEDMKRSILMSLTDLGLFYSQINQKHIAESLYFKALEVAKMRSSREASLGNQSWVLGYLSHLYYDLGNYEKLLSVGQKRLDAAYEFVQYDDDWMSHLVDAYRQLSKYHLAMEDFDASKKMLAKARDLEARYGVSSYGSRIITSEIFKAEGDRIKAERELRAMLDDYIDLEDYYSKIPEDECIEMVGRFIALESFDQARKLNLLIQDELIKVLNNLDKNDVKKRSLFELHLLKSIDCQLRIKNYAPIDNQVVAFEKARMIIRNNFTNYSDISDRLLFTKHTTNITEGLLDLLYNSDTEDHSLIYKAVETTKATSLISSWKSSQVLNMNERADIFDQEKELTESLPSARQRLYEEKDSLAMKVKENEVDELISELEALKSQLAELHPLYYELKYENKIPSLTELQTSLLEDETLVSFFEGQKFLYIMVISNGTETSLRKIDIRKYRKQVDAYAESMLNPSLDYEEISQELYLTLLAPLEDELKDHLIFIPSGSMNKVPFASLLTETGEPLIKTKRISLQPSIALLHYSRRTDKGNQVGSALLMAPKFEESQDVKEQYASRGELVELAFSIPEVIASNRIVSGEILQGAEATKKNFLQKAPYRDLIHLATHAKSNIDAPDKSMIAFSNDEHDFLYLNELSELSLPAKMIVLSACETGLGKVYKGEGVMSLANACFFAGAQSVVATQWAVEDKTTFDIITSFYEYLKKGVTKDEALQSAQLDYLESHSGEWLHPYYWAGFSIIGNSESLEFRPSKLRYLWLLAIPVMLALVYSKRKQRFLA